METATLFRVWGVGFRVHGLGVTDESHILPLQWHSILASLSHSPLSTSKIRMDISTLSSGVMPLRFGEGFWLREYKATEVVPDFDS